MKRSLVYVIIFSSVFVMGRSMSINNDIDDIEKEIKFIKLHQKNLNHIYVFTKYHFIICY